MYFGNYFVATGNCIVESETKKHLDRGMEKGLKNKNHNILMKILEISN